MSEDVQGVNIARLRARVLWLAARSRFAKGALSAKFSEDALWKMLEIQPEDPFGGLQAVLSHLPKDAQPVFRKKILEVFNPSPDPDKVGDSRIIEILDYWRDQTGRTSRVAYNQRRKSVVRSRLAEGYTEEQLKRAVDLLARSEFHVEKGFTDTRYCFDLDKLERWLSIQEKVDPADEEAERVARETIRRRRRR